MEGKLPSFREIPTNSFPPKEVSATVMPTKFYSRSAIVFMSFSMVEVLVPSTRFELVTYRV